MKREEKIASEFLKACFGEEPSYEPRGKGKPPDFCIGRTAFEVRRLNENVFCEDGTAEGLERVEFALRKAVYGELSKIPYSQEKGSFSLRLRFQRPLGLGPGRIAKDIRRKAQSHYSSGLRVRQIVFADEVSIELNPSGEPLGEAFLPDDEDDGDSGGWVREIYQKNIRLAAQEKIRKTKRVAGRFDRWVLVLVDYIMFGSQWPEDAGVTTLDLQHFSSVAIISRHGSLEMEWPNNSLRGTP